MPVFHFNRIVPKRIRSVFICFLSGSVELITNDVDTKENAMACYDTVEVENRLKGDSRPDKLHRGDVRIFVRIGLKGKSAL